MGHLAQMNPLKIGIIDLGMGNIGSLTHSIQRIGLCSERIYSTSDYSDSYDAIFLPGVGCFAYAMKSLRDTGLDRVILDHIESNKKIIGICLGFQLLFEFGDEGGGSAGLGLLPGQCERIDKFVSGECRLPNIGFRPTRLPASLIDSKALPCFYYMHSYGIGRQEAHSCEAYGSFIMHGTEVISAVSSGNILGFQFHPEKSQLVGLKLLGEVLGVCQ